MSNPQKEVVIYTLDYCPYCMKAKIFLQEHNIQYKEISCEDNEDQMRQNLTEKYNLKSLATFPQIIVDGINIGGFSDLVDKFNQIDFGF